MTGMVLAFNSLMLPQIIRIMKNRKIHISTILVMLTSVLFIITACKEEEDFPRTRLFSPVLNEELYSVDNTIIVNMAKMKQAISYTLEVSRDTFKTIDYTIETDTNYIVINGELAGEELLWFTYYQVQATAHADDPEYDSKPANLGSVRTQKYPSNMGTPSSFDVLDTQARVFWTTTGNPVTDIKVFALSDVRLVNPLLAFEVTPEQQAEAEAIIYGLAPSTQYYIAIYSEDQVRGWEAYTTRPPLVSGDNVINLAGYIAPLGDTLADLESGSIVLLEGGRTYTTGGYIFDKSITFMSGYSFVPALPLIDCTSNFAIAGDVRVDSIVFREIAFSGDFASRYVFNPQISSPSAFNIGEIKFVSCRIRELRGVTRLRGLGNLEKYTIIDCVIDSIADYAILTLDTDLGVTVGDITFKNSTFSKCHQFLTVRTNSNSVLIEDCTISEVPTTDQKMFRWRGGDGNNNVANGITIRNVIWGHAWDRNTTGGYAARGDDGGTSLDNTTFIIVNTYSTSLFSFVVGYEIPGFPVGNYTGTSTDLWINPLAGVDFSFLDMGFAGKNDCGDPRWRPGRR